MKTASLYEKTATDAVHKADALQNEKNALLVKHDQEMRELY
jgi:hypothetical protein